MEIYGNQLILFIICNQQNHGKIMEIYGNQLILFIICNQQNHGKITCGRGCFVWFPTFLRWLDDLHLLVVSVGYVIPRLTCRPSESPQSRD